jgi:hypothetical protein
MRRAAMTVCCLASLLGWLAQEPFRHAHGPEEGGVVHSHVVLEHDDHHDDDHHADDPHDDDHDRPSTPELEPSHDPGHHGVNVSFFCGQAPHPPVLIAEVGEAFRLIETPVRKGWVIEQPVRAHDPPSRLSSNPRSPPA